MPWSELLALILCFGVVGWFVSDVIARWTVLGTKVTMGTVTLFTVAWWIELVVWFFLYGLVFLGVVSLAKLYKNCARGKKRQ